MTSWNGNIFRVTGPFVRRIRLSPVNSPHKGQWSGALMFSLIYVWINGWLNNREAGDLTRHRFHYDVIVMEDTDISDTSRYHVCYFLRCRTRFDIIHVHSVCFLQNSILRMFSVGNPLFKMKIHRPKVWDDFDIHIYIECRKVKYTSSSAAVH